MNTYLTLRDEEKLSLKQLSYLFRDLLILTDGLELSPLGNLTSIFGNASSWFADVPNSEFQIIDRSNLIRLAKYLNKVTIPHFAGRPPDCFTVWPEAGATADGNEEWFFINGVATDQTIATWNGQALADLFQRPINVIFNPTNALILDLIECAFDRTFNWPTEIAKYAVAALAPALRSKKKVVVIAHSQGGIIISSALYLMLNNYKRCKAHLGKLEIYTFACPADEMASMSVCIKEQLDTKRERRLAPYLEHFANRHDLICRLGILRRSNDIWNEQHPTDPWSRFKKYVYDRLNEVLGEDFFDINIVGDLYINDRRGHLLNAHYLPTFRAKQYQRMKDGLPCSQARLYDYLNGGKPRPFKAPAQI